MLTRYDQQLRTISEVAEAPELTHIGPLWLATYPDRGRGFVTYADLPADPATLIDAAVNHFATDSRVAEFEWKTRGHDHVAGLLDLLVAAGFELEEEETVMAGPIDSVLTAGEGLPDGFELQRASAPSEIYAATALAGQVFGNPPEHADGIARELLALDPNKFEMWLVRDAAGQVVCSGRVEFIKDTEFASIFGGACLPEYRGRGIYRALTAARAQAAKERGKTHLHSDCTKYSRPILERAGLQAITTSVPAVWRR